MMTDHTVAYLKSQTLTIKNILDSGEALVASTQNLILSNADLLLAEIEATVPFHEGVRIGKYVVPMERSWLGYLKHCADIDRWTAPSQKVLVSDCLEMIAIIEAHRKPPAPTPTRETPVTDPADDQIDHLKRLFGMFGNFLDGGNSLVAHNQKVLLGHANWLLSEVAAIYAKKGYTAMIGGTNLTDERAFLVACGTLAREDRWHNGSQKLLVDDCLEMAQILERHRKTAEPTPSQETPVAEPMTDGDLVFHVTQIARYREILARNAICWSDQATLVVYAEDLAREVRRLRDIPPAAVVDAVTALGAMLQGHLAGVATEVRDCLRMASDVCDAIEERDQAEYAIDAVGAPRERLVDAAEVDARLQEIVDAMYEQGEDSDQQASAAWEGILRLQGWIDGKTDHVPL